MVVAMDEVTLRPKSDRRRHPRFPGPFSQPGVLAAPSGSDEPTIATDTPNEASPWTAAGGPVTREPSSGPHRL